MERIVFLGTPKFAAGILEDLITAGFNVVGVVTQPDRLVGRKRELEFSEVKKVALKYQLPVIQPVKIKKDYQAIIDLKPDLIISAAFGQIVGVELLEYPKYRAINVHGSLLPKYRGGAPIQRAIENGDKETGITIMYMEKGMDTGDMLYQKSLKIEDNDTSTTLFAKLSRLGSSMLLEFLPRFFRGEFTPIKQNEAEVTFAYNLTKEEEYIDFSLDAFKTFNKIRSLLDNPGAYFYFPGFASDEYRMKIIEATPVNYTHHALNGEVIEVNKNDFVIACANNTALVIKRIKPNGKAEMAARDFINGSLKKYIGGK